MELECDYEAEKKLLQSIRQVTQWVESHQYRAYDPGDGAKSFLRHLAFKNESLLRLLTAAVLRSPFEVRPWIGIRPHISTKGMGYMAWGYVRMFAATGEDCFRQKAEHCLKWLVEKTASGGSGHACWGNDFSFSTRAGTIPSSTPTIVWSSLIGLAFVEAFEVLGREEYLHVARSTAAWIHTLPVEVTSRGVCISYVPGRQSSIHNSNMLGASLLARISKLTRNSESASLAREAMLYSCTRQNEDGGWFYGEDPKYHWIDNFHTGYNLDSLKRYEDSIGSGEFTSNLRKGFEYFKTRFFERSGRPKYYHDRALPIDIQCAAQSIETLTEFSDTEQDSLRLAMKVAAWTIENMQSGDGHFYYRDLGWKKVKTPMLHWGQGTMFKALAHLFARLSKPDESAQTCQIGMSREVARGTVS